MMSGNVAYGGTVTRSGNLTIDPNPSYITIGVGALTTDPTVSERDRLLKEIDELQKQVTDLKAKDGEKMSMSEFKQMRLELTGMVGKARRLRDALDRFEKMNNSETHRIRNAELTKSLKDLQEKYDVLSLAVKRNQPQVDVDAHNKAMARIADLETLLALKEAEHTKEVTSLQGQLDASKTALAAVNAARDKAVQEVESLKMGKSSYARLSDEFRYVETKRVEAETKLKVCQQELFECNKRLGEADAVAMERDAKIAELQKQKQNAEALRSRLNAVLQGK